jgi:hypothetical protein
LILNVENNSIPSISLYFNPYYAKELRGRTNHNNMHYNFLKFQDFSPENLPHLKRKTGYK